MKAVEPDLTDRIADALPADTLLGLQGDVRQEDFEAVREGLDPGTGVFLRQRQSADRTGADGEVQSHGRHLYDFTISAPKSI